MRILISTWPAHGHLLPLLPIAHAAERAGHDVVVASGAEGAAEAARRGLRTWEVGPSRAEANAAFGAAIGDLSAVAPERRMATVVEGVFGAAAFPRAEALVPLVEEWRPDLVVHPVTELAAAVAAERCGARHAVHGLGPLPREAWDWFGARFRDLCTTWDVPALGTAILERPYLDDCPPSLQPDAVAAFGNRRRVRAMPGEAAPGEHFPWSDDDLAGLPFEQTVHLTLGTMFHGATEVFQTALEGLRSSTSTFSSPWGPTPIPPASGRNRHTSSSPTSSPTSYYCRTAMRSSPRAAPARSSPRSVPACLTSSCPRVPTSSSTAPPPRRRGSPSPSHRPT